jgi:hypothetical protein
LAAATRWMVDFSKFKTSGESSAGYFRHMT